MTVSAAITNLAKYNEGQLDFVWLELPASDAEWQDALNRIDIGKPDAFGIPYEEWFVSDYEDDTDCHVSVALGEYPSRKRLDLAGELASELADMDRFELEQFCDENNLYWGSYGLEDVFSTDDDEDVLNEMVRGELESGGWNRVFWFLRGLMDDPMCPYVRINAYNNMVPARDLDDDIESARAAIFSDALDEISLS